MMDTKGPEIRTTVTADGNAVVYHTGDIVTISGNPGRNHHSRLHLPKLSGNRPRAQTGRPPAH